MTYKTLYFLTMIALFVAAGCETSSVLGPEASDPFASAGPEDDIPVVDETSDALLATVTLDDGSQVEFLDAGGTILYLATGARASAELTVARASNPDPVSLFEHFSAGDPAPTALRDAVERLGIEPSPVVVDAEKLRSFYADWNFDDPRDFAEFFEGSDVVRTNRYGNANYYRTMSLAGIYVYSINGQIRVRIYQRYYNIWSFSYRYRLQIDKDVQAHQLLYAYDNNMFDERYWVRITEASGNYWHLAMD